MDVIFGHLVVSCCILLYLLYLVISYCILLYLVISYCILLYLVISYCILLYLVELTNCRLVSYMADIGRRLQKMESEMFVTSAGHC